MAASPPGDGTTKTIARPAPLPALTALRFLAAAVVVWVHFAPGSLSYVAAGNDMVALFFVLSGFILTYNACPAPGWTRAFYVARMARVYPAYLLGLSLALLGAVPQHALCPTHTPFAAPLPLLGITLLGVQSWLPATTLCLNFPAWSLSCEVFFYLLFPLLLPLLMRRSDQQVWLVLLGAWLVRVVLVLSWVALPSPRPDGLLIQSLPLMRLPDFVMGMALGCLYTRGLRLDRPLLCLGGAVLWAVVVAMGGLGVEYVQAAMLLPAFAVVLFVLAQPSSATRVLSHPTLVLLGEASYGLYILHWPVYAIVADLGLLSPVLGGWPAFLAYAALCVAVSLLSLRLLEGPSRRAIRKVLAPERGMNTNISRAMA